MGSVAPTNIFIYYKQERNDKYKIIEYLTYSKYAFHTYIYRMESCVYKHVMESVDKGLVNELGEQQKEQREGDAEAKQFIDSQVNPKKRKLDEHVCWDFISGHCKRGERCSNQHLCIR